MNAKLANKLSEVIFIGLPGPTHNYGGLAADNLASSANQGSVSRPMDAALQVLGLARLLLSLGLTVGILPPQLRPHLKELKKHFSGDEESIIAQAAAEKPELLEALSSSSAMWVANAATATPPQDNDDACLHLTVANLHTNLHRRIEALDSYLTLRQIFAHVPRAIVDLPLDAMQGFRDEGAANHMRLAPSHAAVGLNVFVYGTDGGPRDPKMARQTLASSQEIITRHHVAEEAAICIKQNPAAIEHGVFHNDVIAVANEYFLLVHEEAYAMGSADLDYIAESYAARTGQALSLRVIRREELTLEEAVATYFFNSQIVSLPGGGMALIAPSDTRELFEGKAWALLEKIALETGNPITQLHHVDLHQSMKNGGGPACLRLRVLMDEAQLSAMRAHNRVLVNASMIGSIEETVRRNYPEKLSSVHINYELYRRCRDSLQALGICLGLDLLPA
ncbi:MAG: N-succinylarginine dihydrolase [Alphaproteobacteria bacterium]|nr:N-succinylarginine dihydrolase [Alphaproteobacteria bacterium]